MKVVEKINHYSFDDVVDNFDINPITKCKTLEDWVNAPASPLTPTHASMLADLPEEYNENYIGWNEEELKMNIVSIVFKVANVNQKGIVKTFYERRLSGSVENKKISVVVDCMIAARPSKSLREKKNILINVGAVSKPRRRFFNIQSARTIIFYTVLAAKNIFCSQNLHFL